MKTTRLLCLIAAFCCGTAQAQVPDKLGYQGFLTDPAGAPIDATVALAFRLYSAAAGGMPLYLESQNVPVTKGVFSVVIGSIVPLTLPFDVQYYVGISVEMDAEMVPRQPLTTAPYAFRAASTDALAVSASVAGTQLTGAISTATLSTGNLTGTIVATQIADGAVDTSKLDAASIDAKYFRQGGNSFGADPAVLGIGDNFPLELWVNGARALRIQPDVSSPIWLGGSSDNVVTAGASGAVIGGGGAGGFLIGSASCGASCANRATDAFGTIAGGVGNQVGDDAGQPDDRPFATVGGGLGNIASGSAATVAGGFQNRATGPYASVSGGFISHASGFYATVAGGEGNLASGQNSIVLGGSSNVASGAHSVALGYRANANQASCMVYGGWSTTPVPPSCLGTPNIVRIMADHGMSIDYFSARADGGGNKWIYFGDNFAGKAITTSIGAYLSDPGGQWVGNSDMGRKTAFRKVDTRKLLAGVVNLPITSWRYIGEANDKRHIGPMAQDFWAAFRLGDDDTHIGTIDETGVALAAIQGLHKVVLGKERRIRKLEAELSAIKAKLGLK